MHALGVAPPEINGRDDTETRGEFMRRDGHAGAQHFRDLVEQTTEILARADAADRAGENVVEDECGDGKAREEWAHGVAYDDVHAAAHIHAAAFEVYRAHREAEKHDRQDEPR